MTTKRPTKPASELLTMIQDARRAISAVPGAYRQTGMMMRLEAQEKRLGLKGKPR